MPARAETGAVTGTLTGAVKRIADSTVRRLSVYLRYLEELEGRAMATTSSEELAARSGTTSAQVRKDLSFFGSFGKRGLGYSVPELSALIRQILGLEREWRVVIVGAGKIGSALSAYRGFTQRGFTVVAVYDNDPRKIGTRWDSQVVRDIVELESDAAHDLPDIAVLAIPADDVQGEVDRIVRAGIKAILNFAPAQVHAPPGVTIKNVNMAMELEGLSYALSHRE
jgi:redox-sensing transcriptional repressor